jgi:hypothetical protein
MLDPERALRVSIRAHGWGLRKDDIRANYGRTRFVIEYKSCNFPVADRYDDVWQRRQ